MGKFHSERERDRERERERERENFIGYSFRLAANDLYYAPYHIWDSTYHGRFVYTSRGALAGTKNSSMGPP